MSGISEQTVNAAEVKTIEIEMTAADLVMKKGENDIEIRAVLVKGEPWINSKWSRTETS